MSETYNLFGPITIRSSNIPIGIPDPDAKRRKRDTRKMIYRIGRNEEIGPAT